MYVYSPASTVIEHDNHGEATLMILQMVMVPATMMSGMMARSTPLMIVRVIIPIVLMIVAVCPIVSIRPISIPIVVIRPTMVTVGSPVITVGSSVVTVGSSVITIRSTIVVSSMTGVAAMAIRWVSGVVVSAM